MRVSRPRHQRTTRPVVYPGRPPPQVCTSPAECPGDRPRTADRSTATKDGDSMIRLTRLSGSPFVLNSDLIERIDTTPDTVITLADGTNYVAAESADEVVHAIRMHRATIIALSETVRVALPELEPEPEPLERPGLATVTDFPTPAYSGLTHEGAEA
ncbi:MAG TPA: hypothetical protein DEQ43_07215 [Nocardioides bacterium]|nr:hypothetical protein [Nocardioides sp.]